MGRLNAAFYPERLEQVGDIETKAVLKKLTTAHQALAELKATAEAMPNQGILISTLSSWAISKISLIGTNLRTGTP